MITLRRRASNGLDPAARGDPAGRPGAPGRRSSRRIGVMVPAGLFRRVFTPTFRGEEGAMPGDHPDDSGNVRARATAWRMAWVALAYALAAWTGQRLLVPGSGFSLIWLAGAVLQAALLLSPPASWPFLLLAALPGNVVTHPGTEPAHLAAMYLHDVVLALSAAAGVRAWLGRAPRPDRLRDMAASLVIGALAAPAATALNPAWFHTRYGEDFALVWWRNALASALGCAVVVPTLLSLARFRGWTLSRRRLAEAGLIAVGVACSGQMAAEELFTGSAVRGERMVTPLPFLVAMAMRFGTGGAGLALMVLSLEVLRSARHVGADRAGELLPLQILLVAVAVPVLLLAALVEERNGAAEQVRLAEERVSLALDASHTGTWDWAVRAGRLSCSATNYRIFGLPEDPPATVRQFWSRVHPGDRARLRQEARHAPLDSTFATELRVLHPDGRVRWLRTAGRAVCAPGGPVEHLIGVNVDITEWKEAELALRSSEARNRAILEAMPDLMFVQDGEGRYLDYYARDPSQLLVPPEQFMGKRMDQILPAYLAVEMRARHDRVLRRGGPEVTEYNLELGREMRTFEARMVRCGSDAVLSVVRDVTAWRRSQAALLEREEELGALTARLLSAQEEERSRVAREIHDDAGQQLAALAFGVSALTRRLAGTHPGEGEALDALQHSIETLADTIRGISHRLHPSVLEFAGLAAALRSHCAEAGAAMGVEVSVHVGPRAERVSGETALAAYRIVQEALRNVARHAGAAHAWVAVSRVGSELRVRVRDDGHGMEEPEAASSGGGLGLVSMRERARLVGGTLRVFSPARGGTCVEARLPRHGLAAHAHPPGD